MARIGVGLDIGTSSIKIVELEGSGKNVKLTRFGTIPLTEGNLAGGVIKDQVSVSKALSNLLKLIKVKYTKMLIAIAGQAVIVRHIKMPLMTKDELANAIQWEAERYIPFPIDEVSLDFDIIGRDEQQHEIEVMLVCAHNDIINSHVGTLKEAGLQPVVIDIQPFSLMRALGFENSPNSSGIAILDIGAGTTDLTIIKAGIPRFTRIIPFAGNRMTENISRDLQLNFNDAEKLKVTYSDALYPVAESTPGTQEYQVNFSIQNALHEMLLELRRSFDYYQLQQRNEQITKLIVAGGGSKLKNIIPYLSRELGIEVVSGQVNDQFKYSDNKMKLEFEEQMPIYMVAFGLALREVTEA